MGCCSSPDSGLFGFRDQAYTAAAILTFRPPGLTAVVLDRVGFVNSQCETTAVGTCRWGEVNPIRFQQGGFAGVDGGCHFFIRSCRSITSSSPATQRILSCRTWTAGLAAGREARDRAYWISRWIERRSGSGSFSVMVILGGWYSYEKERKCVSCAK